MITKIVVKVLHVNEWHSLEEVITAGDGEVILGVVSVNVVDSHVSVVYVVGPRDEVCEGLIRNE